MNSEDSEWILISLRISSEILTPAEISEMLGTKPTSSFEKGTLMSPSNPKSQVRDTNLWLWETELPNTRSLVPQLENLISFVEGKATEFRKLLLNCDMDVMCGYNQPSDSINRSIVLTSDLMERFAAFSLDLI